MAPPPSKSKPKVPFFMSMEDLENISGNPIKDRKEVIPSGIVDSLEITMEEAARNRIAASPFRQFKLNSGELGAKDANTQHES